ncbi:MAG: FHA domain-containing protein, partial [Spirochaetes bacterium]|nr:FHA domain-containing protein [Spirochaetota bacterium]
MDNKECYLFYLDKRLLLKKNIKIKIGRSRENDIVFNDNTVSREHSVIKWESPNFKIKDLNSTNGMFVNGKKVKS